MHFTADSRSMSDASEYGNLIQAFRNELATRFMVRGHARKMPAQLKLGSATNDRQRE